MKIQLQQISNQVLLTYAEVLKVLLSQNLLIYSLESLQFW